MNAADFNRLVYRANVPLYSEWLDSLVAQVAEHVSVRHNYYRFLYHLVLETMPQVAIELGVEFGIASAHMSLAASTYGGIVIGVDINGHGIPKHQVPAHCPNYYFVEGDSTDPQTFITVANLCESKPVGVLFQDSSHHYAPSVREWEMYTRLMEEGSIFVCDDITPDFFEPGVDEKSLVAYFDERPARIKLKFPDVLHKGNTIGVMVL